MESVHNKTLNNFKGEIVCQKTYMKRVAKTIIKGQHIALKAFYKKIIKRVHEFSFLRFKYLKCRFIKYFNKMNIFKKGRVLDYSSLFVFIHILSSFPLYCLFHS